MPRHLATALVACAVMSAGPRALAQQAPWGCSTAPPIADATPSSVSPVMLPLHPYLVRVPDSVPVMFDAEGAAVVISALADVSSQPAFTDPRATGAKPYSYLCTTPCALFLRPGGTTLHLGTVGEMQQDVTVVANPGIARRITLRRGSGGRALGGLAAAVFGGLGLTAGVVLVSVSPMLSSSPSSGGPTPTDFLIGGGATTLIGGGIFALGVALLSGAGARIVRDQPARWLGASAAPIADGRGLVLTTGWRF